jgi:CxxC motif-containing protein (DUF1111 family)
MRRVALLLLVLPAFSGCDCGDSPPDEQPAVAEIFAPIGEPMPHASDEQLDDFEAGREVAMRRFDVDSGLGPEFNVSFCAACHEKPTFGGSSPRYRDFNLTGMELSDGSTVLLGKDGVQTQFRTEPPHRVATDERETFAVKRNAVPFFGLGALAEIPEESILANADPDDEDDDGISGRPNFDRGFVGRFGRKAQTVSIEGFIRGPLFNHLGVTTNPLSQQMKANLPVPSALDDQQTLRSALDVGFCPHCQAAAPSEPLEDDDDVPDPEMSEEELFALVSFSMLLAAPEPDELGEVASTGEGLFDEVGCTGCHVPGLEGPRGMVMAYTDMLLHDMGPELADGIEQGVATGSEFRTQPLWGLAATGPYLHDGRADTIDGAIRWHGGEAESAKERYEELSKDEREAIVEFLESLGGRDQRSSGLLAPGEPVAEVGEWGGPERALDDDELALFEQGREVFDRDSLLSEGLGSTFNGDSCRACHFEPTIGGAGPVGLNVTRQGVIDPSDGEFYEPEGGTMVHRLHVDSDKRPHQHADANVIEMRQTPPVFGLGLIDRIADSAIEANADPDDDDGDGISGRVARLEDGRIGRFGWKAGLPTLEDFVRDAVSNELGLTLSPDASFVAGVPEDDDGVADPEFGGADYGALVFYSMMLGPPPAAGELDAEESVGEQRFGEVGCAGCHVPSLATDDGEDVALYSDLLLHDVAPDDYRGVAEADAGMREFRTPPLWGIGQTGPYMHDGLAPTLDAAIRRHAGEAEQVVSRYEALSDEDRQALIAFLEAL